MHVRLYAVLSQSQVSRTLKTVDKRCCFDLIPDSQNRPFKKNIAISNTNEYIFKLWTEISGHICNENISLYRKTNTYVAVKVIKNVEKYRFV